MSRVRVTSTLSCNIVISRCLMEKVTLPHEAFEPRSRGLRRGGFHSSDCRNRDKNCAVQQPISSSSSLLFSSLLRVICCPGRTRTRNVERKYIRVFNFKPRLGQFRVLPWSFFFFPFQRLSMNIHFYTSCKKRDISGIHKIE